jgi:hypothetical protein
MFLVASVIVPATAFAAGENIFVSPATTTIAPAGSTGSSITVTVSSNTSQVTTGAAAAISFDNTKLQLTAIAKAADPVTLGAGWAGYPTVANTAAFIAVANNGGTVPGTSNVISAGTIPTIGWFTTDGSTLSASADHGIFSATFTVIAAGDSSLTPVIVPGVGGFLDASGTAFDPTSLTAGAVVNTAPAAWSISAPATASVNIGGTATATVSTAVVSGAPGAITFSASGLPSGVTADFVPASAAAGSSSTLTFTASGSATSGTFPVSVSGSDGSTSHSATINLTVVVPNDFSIAAPASKTVQAGTSGTVAVTSTVLNGTPGSITYSASGLPAGATPTFTPASAAAGLGSSLSIATTAATVPGTYAVTISGNDGTYTRTASISLVVTTAAAPNNANVNVTGTMDGGFLGLSCPTSITMPLTRGNTNQTNAPCVVSTNTVWQLSANDTATTDHVGFMVTGRPVDGTTKFALYNSMHVLSGGRPVGCAVQGPTCGQATNPFDPFVVYDFNRDLSNATQSPLVGSGTNTANVGVVLSQYVAPNDHAGSYGIQVVFSAVSIF